MHATEVTNSAMARQGAFDGGRCVMDEGCAPYGSRIYETVMLEMGWLRSVEGGEPGSRGGVQDGIDPSWLNPPIKGTECPRWLAFQHL
jgi:hypothetical protein